MTTKASKIAKDIAARDTAHNSVSIESKKITDKQTAIEMKKSSIIEEAIERSMNCIHHSAFLKAEHEVDYTKFIDELNNSDYIDRLRICLDIIGDCECEGYFLDELTKFIKAVIENINYKSCQQ